jgi:hypothetical protein
VQISFKEDFHEYHTNFIIEMERDFHTSDKDDYPFLTHYSIKC